MSRLKRALRVHAPATYRLLVATRNAERRGMRMVQAPGTTQLMRKHPAVVGVVDQQVGMGGLLHNAARLLYAGSQDACQVSLAFESATYRPSFQPQGDWLEAYFDRLVPRHDNVAAPRVLSSKLADRIDLDPALWGDLVWGAIRPRATYRDAADALIQGPFVGVHFRGSDKYLEARRASEELVLRAAEKEMQQRGIDRVFVASDEQQFVDRAIERFGTAVFSLPLEAVAEDGTPPHFTKVAGEIKAREVLTTMLVLSRAAVVVRTESLMSQWALGMSAATPDCVVVRPS